MKIIWTKAIIQSWFDELAVYTGARFDYSVVMDYDKTHVSIRKTDETMHIPICHFNHVDVDDSVLIVLLTYTFGIFSELNLPLQQHMLYHTENTIQTICDHFCIPFLSKEELDVQLMKIDRIIFNDPDSTRYKVGNRLINKFSILMYTITDIGPLVSDKRNITLTSQHETLVLDEEDVVRNYHIMANPTKN